MGSCILETRRIGSKTRIAVVERLGRAPINIIAVVKLKIRIKLRRKLSLLSSSNS
jgi:hypothetical protein